MIARKYVKKMWKTYFARMKMRRILLYLELDGCIIKLVCVQRAIEGRKLVLDVSIALSLLLSVLVNSFVTLLKILRTINVKPGKQIIFGQNTQMLFFEMPKMNFSSIKSKF